MGKRYLPVVLRNRQYRMYQDDFKFIKCIKKASHPRLPAYQHSASEKANEGEMVFAKIIEE